MRRLALWLFAPLSLAACDTPHGKERTRAELLDYDGPDGRKPDRARWRFDFQGERVELQLEPNRTLFADDFRQFRGTDGAWQEVSTLERCHYRGRLIRHRNGRASEIPGTFAAISTCLDAQPTLRGMISAHGKLYSIQPAGADVTADHRITRVELPSAAADAVGLPEWEGTLRSPTGAVAAPPAGDTWVELLMVNDEGLWQRHGDDTETRAAAIANILDQIYDNEDFSTEVRITLTGMVTFVGGDPFTPNAAAGDGGEVDESDLLTKFSNWTPPPGIEFDQQTLLSAYDFEDSTVGLAWVGGMCWPGSSAAIVQTGASTAFDATITAHEVGHNFDMAHDGGGCDANKVMAASAGAAVTDFSACSRTDIDNYFATLYGEFPRDACLEDVPNTAWTDPVCGNGIVEAGEACDCNGTDCTGIDDCCDGNTCQLNGGAECSETDACCTSSCTFVTAGTECRAARHNTCDAAETCDGVSAKCPSDVTTADGTACMDAGADGQCYRGECPTKTADCIANIGAGNVFNDTLCSLPGGWDICDTHACYDGFNCSSIGIAFSDGVDCGGGNICVDGTCVSPMDNCPGDPDKTEPGICGCGTPDTDTDADGTPDCNDDCPDDPAATMAPCPGGTTGGTTTGGMTTTGTTDGDTSTDDATDDTGGTSAGTATSTGGSTDDTSAGDSSESSDGSTTAATSTGTTAASTDGSGSSGSSGGTTAGPSGSEAADDAEDDAADDAAEDGSAGEDGGTADGSDDGGTPGGGASSSESGGLCACTESPTPAGALMWGLPLIALRRRRTRSKL